MADETEYICDINKVVNENENNEEMETTRRDEQFDIKEGILNEDMCTNMDDANATQCQEDCQDTNDGRFSHPIDIRNSETSKPIQCMHHRGTVPLDDSVMNFPGQNDKTSNTANSTMSEEKTVCKISTPKTERKPVFDILHQPRTPKVEGLTPMAPRDVANKEHFEINQRRVCEMHNRNEIELQPMIANQQITTKCSAVDKKRPAKQIGQDKRQSTQHFDIEGNNKEKTNDSHRHKTFNILLFKRYWLCLAVSMLISLISLTLSIYVVIVCHVSTSFIKPENITTSGIMQRETIQSVSLHIDWKAIVHANPNNIVKIPWIVDKPNFIQLHNSGQLIHVTGNGTYAIFATFNLDIESAKSLINSKHRTISTLICINNSRSKEENCQKQRLPPKTAVTVPLFTVIQLLKGDFIWISMKGVDQIYKSNAGNYLTITRHPT